MKTKMKNLPMILLVSLALMTAATVNAFSKELPVNAFQKLSVEGNLHLVFVPGNDEKLRIEGNNATAMASVSVRQNGTELTISREPSTDDNEAVTVYLPVSNLNTLIISGDATVDCETTLHGDVISLLHKGTGAVKLKSDANLLQTMTTKSGRIAVDGDYSRTVSRMDASDHLIVAYSK